MLKSRIAFLGASKACAVLPVAILLALALCQSGYAQTKVWTGAGGDFSWHNANNWNPVGVPGASDDVVINTANPELTITHSSSTTSINSLNSDTAIDVTGGTLVVVSTADVMSDVFLKGGTLQGGNWTFADGARLRYDGNSNNRIIGLVVNAIDSDTVVIHGSIVNSRLSIEDGLVLNGRLQATNGGATVAFRGGDQTVSGNATIRIGGTTGSNRSLSADDGAIVTLAPTVWVFGERVWVTSGAIGGAGGSFINEGTVSARSILDGEQGDHSLQVTGSLVSFTNNGLIEGVDGSELRVQSSQFTNNSIAEASGGGILTVSANNWTNRGTIVADNAPVNIGGTFNTTAGMGTFTNVGGNNFIVTGTIHNAGATIVLSESTGNWTLNNGGIHGGVVEIADGTFLRSTLGDNQLVDVEVNGTIVIPSSQNSLKIKGTTTFQTARLSGSHAVIGFDPDSVITGTILFAGASTFPRYVAMNGIDGTLFVGPTGSITSVSDAASNQMVIGTHSGGQSGFGGSMTLINQGVISFVTPNRTLTVQPAVFSNDGIVEATNESTLQVSPGNLVNFASGELAGGTWQAGSGSTLNFPGGASVHTLGPNTTVILAGATSNFPAINSLRTINSGATFELAGGRDFAASPGDGQPFTNNGSLILGPQSNFTITSGSGNYVQGATGALHAAIDGKHTPANAPLGAAGTASLNGALNVSFAGGFTPTLGNTATVLSSTGGVAGQFASVSHPLKHSCLIDVLYRANTVAIGLETTPPVAVCQDITVQLDATGNATIAAGDIDGGSSDNCAIDTIEISRTTFTCEDLGTNIVTLTVTDAAGNVDTCEAIVTVQATGAFLGMTGGSWFDAANWCAGLPNQDTAVTLDDLVLVDALGAEALSVLIQDGGELVIGSPTGASLNVVETLLVESGGALSLIEGGMLTAHTLHIEAGGLLSITDPTAMLAVVDLIIEEGAVLNWTAGTIQVAGLWAHDGTIEVGCDEMAAALIVDDGLVIAPAVTICFDGTLAGNGTVAAMVSSAGVVNPGFSAGAQFIDGDYAQSADGELHIEIGGLSPASEHDVLDVSGEAALGGLLLVELIGGFAPALLDSFTVMAADSISGNFDAMSLPALGAPLFFASNVSATEVTLEVKKIGDPTGSGTVGVPDLLVLLANWGLCAECDDCPGDLTSTCTVGVPDLLILLANWG